MPVSPAAWLVLFLISAGPAAGGAPLFYEADEFLAAAEQIGVIGAARYRAVFVEPSSLGEVIPDGRLEAASEVILNLFEDTCVRAVLERHYPSIGEGWVWEGRLMPPHSGSAVIAFNDRTLAAEVEADGRVFQVRHDGGPVHLIRELSAGDAALLRSAPNAQEQDIYNRTNQERYYQGIYCLAWNDLLGNSARGHSQDMGNNDFFSHTGSNGSTPAERITAAGYSWNSCAENIAAGNSTAAATMQQWINSPGHYANILSTTKCDLGVGYAYYSSSTYGYYWTQNFGRWTGVYTCPYVPPPVSTPTPPPTTATRAPLQLYAGDFNGNAYTDIGIFRNGLWTIRGVTRAYFGQSGDIPIPADFNGDGCSDLAVFRPTSGLWSARGVTRFYFGQSGDCPIPMNYQTGYPVAGIFRPSTGLWSFKGYGRAYFGQSGDIPVPGPYVTRFEKWGEVYCAIFRPTSGLWSVRGVTRCYFGGSGDTPVPGAYTTSSSETWKAAIFRSSNGLWQVRGVTRAYFGQAGDIPVPADYIGYWGDEMAIFRNGLWSIRGGARIYFGQSGDIPVTR